MNESMRVMNSAAFGVFAILLAIAAAACGRSDNDDDPAQAVALADPAAPCAQPLETRAPNVPSQQPTFPGQTRACPSPSNVNLDVVVVAGGLSHPWAVEPLPDGALLVTEKPGRMRIVSAAGDVGEPLEGLPEVDDDGQGGLLDVALSPTFATDRVIYWSFSEPRDGGNATSVARGVISADQRRLDDVRVIFRAQPTYDGDKHFGSRLVFGTDGMLFVTLGERSDLAVRPQAQQMDSHMGKLLRITTDGAAPADNPFVGQANTMAEIWASGLRNVQAATVDSQGRLWTIEHGPQGGDELNLIERGRNYGWPLVTFGEEYSGDPIPDAVTTHPDYVDPHYYWDPVIAPSGAVFYSGAAVPEWRGNLFVGSLKDKRLVRLVLDGDRVVGEEHLLIDRDKRVRDVREGADGALYVVTDESDGELWRITPSR